MVHRLYIFEEIDKLQDGFIKRYMMYLSAQRKEKTLSYRFALDRKLSASAYMLLRIALKDNYGIDKPVVFSYGKYGKPLLRDYPQIHFNLSHCKSAVACAVSDNEIGVDVQEIAPVSDELAKRVLTAKEYAAHRVSAYPDEFFCELWTAKESWLKKSGLGIGLNLTTLSAENIGGKTLFKGSDYYCCLVSEVSVPLLCVNVQAQTLCEYPFHCEES